MLYEFPIYALLLFGTEIKILILSLYCTFAGGGAVPASVQSNDYRNSIARTDDTFPSPIHPSVSSNLFPRIVASHSSGQYSFLNPAPPSVPSNPFATMVTTPSIGQYPFLNPVPPSVPSNPFSTTVTTPSLDAAQPLPAPYNPLISPNSLSNNLCSVPSTSVTQPVSIFGPNKSPFISSFPAITAPQYPSINNSSAGAASIDGLNYTTSFASSSYMSSTVTAPVTVSAPCIASLETASSPATFWPSQTSQTRGGFSTSSTENIYMVYYFLFTVQGSIFIFLYFYLILKV